MKETERLYASISNIDDWFIEEAQAGEIKKAPVWRKWAGLAACLVIAVFGVVSVVCPTVSDERDAAVLPPSRIGAFGIEASLGNQYTFESALSEADVVARIEVGNWLAEDTNLYKTYYEATVLQCFKGSIPETFTLLQDGCSAATMKTYPLFTSGNEILVFLKKASVTTYESPYWIIGSYTTLLDVFYDEIGNRYYADRYGILGKSIDIDSNYARENPVSSEVLAIAEAHDPIVSEMHYSYPYIFSEADMITLIEKSKKTITVINLSQGSSGEFAGDMHRPEGVHENIGSALALKMSITDDVSYTYSVLIRIPEGSTLEEAIKRANDSLDTAINIDDAVPVNVLGSFDAAGEYYCPLTSEQIIALAKSGTKCLYIGSGQGEYKDMNWDTRDGINAYCELNGDMYVFAGDGVEAHPDIFVEE